MRNSHLKEAEPHGAPDFPVQYYWVDSEHPRYEMALHWHHEFEIIRVKKGTLELFLDNEKYVLDEGEIAFVAAGVLHRAIPYRAIYECVVMDLNLLCRHGSGRVTGYLLPLLGEGVRIAQRGTGEDCLREAVGALMEALSGEGPFFELKVLSAATDMVYCLYREGRIRLPEKNLPTGKSRATIAALVAWIEKNYTEKCTLSDLSAVANMGEKYLCRFFREYTGSTPVAYINRLRVERACMKLGKGEENITEIAFACGFNDTSYFCKIFKRYKGMSPRAYRAVAHVI
ncbi:MAG: AraC family transcriptional regulator [Clostridia bacterium]|nr:AraC family transcriptional regulator [Clostridia bacterium]